MASYGLPAQAKAHTHGFLWASKLAVCQAWPFRGFRGLEGFRPGKRQAWTPIKSHGCGLLPALEAHKKPMKWPFRGLEGFRVWRV